MQTLRFLSSPLIHAPGVIAWIKRGPGARISKKWQKEAYENFGMCPELVEAIGNNNVCWEVDSTDSTVQLVGVTDSVYHAQIAHSKSLGLASNHPEPTPSPQTAEEKELQRKADDQAKLVELLSKDESIIRYSLIPVSCGLRAAAVVLHFDGGAKFVTHIANISDEALDFHYGSYYPDCTVGVKHAILSFESRLRENGCKGPVVEIRDTDGNLLTMPQQADA